MTTSITDDRTALHCTALHCTAGGGAVPDPRPRDWVLQIGPGNAAARIAQRTGTAVFLPLLHGSRRQLCPPCLSPYLRHQLHFF